MNRHDAFVLHRRPALRATGRFTLQVGGNPASALLVVHRVTPGTYQEGVHGLSLRKGTPGCNDLWKQPSGKVPMKPLA